MPRKESEAVPEGYGSVPQQEEFGSDQPTLADVYRLFEESFERQLKIMTSRFEQQERLNELTDEMRGTRQRLASPEQDARQPRLALEADVQADKKIRERTEGAATAVQAMHRNSFFAHRVDPDPMCSTIFGVKVEPPALPQRDDFVENGAAAPKSCLSTLEMRTPTVAGGLLHVGMASTATRTTFDQPPLRFYYSTEETNSKRVPIQNALYYSSF